MENEFIIIIISLLLSAFFSGMEIAFVASNRFRIELDKKQGIFPSKIITIFTKNPGQYIATMLVGNNIALVGYGYFMAILLGPYISSFTSHPSYILFIQTIISTAIILFTAEFLPKTIFRNNPNSSLKLFALPIFLFYVLFYPIAKFTTWISTFFINKVFKVDVNESNNTNYVFGKVDIDNLLVESQMDVADDENIQKDIIIFHNALDFSKITLRECIVPRTELIAIEVNQDVNELRQKFIESGHSRILIFEGNIDNIIAYVHSLAMFSKPKSIRDCLHRLPIVPETMPAKQLLSVLTKQHKSIALVVDEFGGTAGIVTIEDIVEEIFGEIEDEHDNIDLYEKQISDNEFVLSGRWEIDYLNSKYNLDIPVNDAYETLAGYIFHHFHNIPVVNETIIIQNFVFKILKVSNTRIELVNLSLR